jgi:3-oxoacyl-[acyl-carrier protein] reductase
VDLGIAGRRAAVAGASAGLGFGVASALACEGVRVAICGRDRAKLDDAALRLGATTAAIPADLSTADGARAFVEAAADAMGGVDILIPNAGGPPPGDFASTPFSAYAEAFELNCLSTIAMCEAAVPRMRAQKWGRIVAITSIAVRQPYPGLILSNTARSAVTAFLKTLAREVAGDGITVNSVQPGAHATDRLAQLGADGMAARAASLPVGRLGDAADFGTVAAFLCSEAANFVTGAAIPVDGGEHQGLM